MHGKTVIITGATNGIGEAIALDLAGQGADTIIVSRNAEKCAAVVDQIRQATGNPNVRHYAADLSSQTDIHRLVEQLNRDLDRLDVLINNAGAWFNSRQLSMDGIEMTWALNHLNYFILSNGLLDLLKHTAAKYGDARIINQSSSAHYTAKMNWDDIEYKDTWDSEGRGELGGGWGVYSQSKLANVLHAFALARQLEGTGVIANAVHPSTVVTGFSTNNGAMYRFASVFRRMMNRTTPAYGAAPAIYLASAPEAATITGAYYGPLHKREDVNPIAKDVAQQDRLWELSLQYAGVAIA